VEPKISDAETDAYAFRVWGYKQGEMVSIMIHLGDRLGLFRTLAEVGTTDADGLAAATGLHPRWVLEWLRGTAAADLVASDDGVTFTLPEAARAVLLDEEHPRFAAGAFGGGRPADFIDRVVDAFRTGIGPDYDAQGENGAREIERQSGGWSRTALLSVVLPGLDGVVAKLDSGARVLDLGCGSGTAVASIAAAFPNAQVDGVDLSRHAIERASELVAALPNASVRLGRAEEVVESGAYDLVLTFDSLHDMTRPHEAIATVRRALRPDGTWLVREVKCWPTWEQNRRNPMLALFYGFSITSCLASATSEPDGAALGTVGLHGDLLRAMSQDAGFGHFTAHDFSDPANLYYEIRI
jgi:2-polyprenyl-3-methyl-5-hydroxy-6-metoxy-1,4-benzoquinol methylase